MTRMEEQTKYIDIIQTISECFQKMKNIRPLSAEEVAYFNREFSISASHNSNAIEGNTFTYDETKLLIEQGIVTGAHSLRESEDIVGYKQAFDFLYDAVKKEQLITEDFIKAIHAFVLRGDEEAGQYMLILFFIISIFGRGNAYYLSECFCEMIWICKTTNSGYLINRCRLSS